MVELVYKTWRAHRNVFERLKGYEKMYQTKITNGERSAYGSGPTRRESQVAAERNWLSQTADPEPPEAGLQR